MNPPRSPRRAGGKANPPAVPRSRASETHRALRDQILSEIKPQLFGDYRASYDARAKLESAFAARLGFRHAVAAHSGTIALLIALRACGVGAGDEVITVGNSDISTTAAIRQAGALPVLCDVLEDDYTIDPSQPEAHITERTSALLPVDLHGHPADVKALRPLADRYGLRIIEDAALAAGATDYRRSVGAFADIAMFSFAPFKPLGSAGNGAMLVTDDAAIAARARLLVGYGGAPAQGLQDDDFPGAPAGYQDYAAEGYNVPLDGLQAALLLVKLPHLAAWTARRREIAAALQAGLAGTAIITPRFRPDSQPTFRSYAIRAPNRDRLHQGLLEAGIEAVIHYAPPVYRYAVYRGVFPNADALPLTERLASEIVNLPVTPELTDAEVDYMIEVTRKLVSQA